MVSNEVNLIDTRTQKSIISVIEFVYHHRMMRELIVSIVWFIVVSSHVCMFAWMRVCMHA